MPEHQNYKDTCDFCKQKGDAIFARIYPVQLNRKWMCLCPTCWENAAKKSLFENSLIEPDQPISEMLYQIAQTANEFTHKIRVFAKQHSTEKIAMRCPRPEIGNAMTNLHIKLGGNWVYIGDLDLRNDMLFFDDSEEYRGYHPDIEKYIGGKQERIDTLNSQEQQSS